MKIRELLDIEIYTKVLLILSAEQVVTCEDFSL